MPRTKHSHRRHSLSFTQFVVRLQQTFSSKNLKSSTPVIQQTTLKPTNPPATISKFPSLIPISTNNHPRIHLSQILYDPSHQLEYLSEIEECSSLDDHDSCYDSMSENHQDRLNLSQINVSFDNIQNHSQTNKFVQLPKSFQTDRFHSTAIQDIDNL